MRRHLVGLFAFLTLALVAVVALQPDARTRFEGDLSHLPPEEALSLLEQPGAYEPEDRNIALLHASLLEATGAFDPARAILEGLLAESPDSAALRNKLAALAVATGDAQAALRYAEADWRAEPGRAARERLGLLHRLSRDTAGEIALLASVPAETLTAFEAGRLAGLLVSTGDVAGAEALYRHLAGTRGPFAEEARKRLVVFLIDAGRPEEARVLAADWYAAGSRDMATVESLLPVFIARGAIDEARWYAEVAMEGSPETGHRLVGVFSRAGHRAIARHLHDTVLAQSDGISREEWVTLVDYAALTGDVSGLQKAMGTAPAGSIPTRQLSDALLQMLRYRGPQALAPYRQLATEELTREAPLVAAAFDIDQARHDSTVRNLVDAAGRDLGDWDQEIWIAMAGRLRGTGFDRQLAASHIPSPRLAEAARQNVAPLSQ